jgi:hypothetical protein
MRVSGSWTCAPYSGQGSKVETAWADYVFHKDYELPSLKEMEEQIGEKDIYKKFRVPRK